MSTATAPTVAGRRGRVGLGEAVRHALTLARRDLLHIKSDPEQLTGMTIQPLMFLVLFVYVFGGAIAGSSREYLQFALPGILVQGITFTGFTTALGLNNDFKRGLVDRFRSLPIARSAVVAGRILADSVRVVWGVLIMTFFGVILGFRFGGGVAGAISALILVAVFGVAVCWPMACIGMAANSPEAVNTWGFLAILPLTFVSTTFVQAETLPGWLQGFANVNPISQVVNATRGLMLGDPFPVAEPLLYSVLWIAGIILVFAPLAILQYRRRV
jgi:ABC transporter DrrB family efflux protein